MITYTYPTYGDIVNEIIFRCGKHLTGDNIDSDTIYNNVHRAVQSVFCKILPYKDWALETALEVNSGSWLGENIASIETVEMYSVDLDEYMECRKTDVREFQSIAINSYYNSWNRSSEIRPICTTYGRVLYVSPTLNAGDNPFDVTIPARKCKLVCYMYPQNNHDYTEKIRIPSEYEELIKLEAMNRTLFKTSDKSQLYSVINQIKTIETVSQSSYKEHRVTKIQTLDSFVSQYETPFNPPTKVPMELQQRLL